MKNIIYFLKLSLAAIVVFTIHNFLLSCVDKGRGKEMPTVINPYVVLHEKKFYINGQFFYPKAVNFLVSLQATNDEVWPTAAVSYFPESRYPFFSKEEALKDLAGQMELVKQLGFNSVRLVGAGEVKISKADNNILTIGAFTVNQRDTTLDLSDSVSYKKYLKAVEYLVNIAGKTGLKVIFLTYVSPNSRATEDHLGSLAFHLKDNPALMAYDLFNEPLYFDTVERTKTDVLVMTKKWDSIVKQFAPHHLTTIGLTGIREVLEWDPNMLGVDFISFHPYEHEPEQVRNEMYWYYKYVDKPWIIGETAIPADGDSISYESQAQFAQKTLKQAWDCNASGYSWWQYKDVKWQYYQASFMGVLNRAGSTITKSGHQVNGTVKPVANEFINFDMEQRKDSCRCFSNYYNYSESPQYRLTGEISDQNGNPIEGAVIMAWSQDWTRLNHTITRADGTFELKANFQFYHWMASATYYSMEKGYLEPKENARYSQGISRMETGTIKLKKIGFSK